MREMVNSVFELPPGIALTLLAKGKAGVLQFTRGGILVSVPVETNVGTLYLSLSQDVVAIPERFQYRLRTKAYRYKLFPSDHPRADALLRWEYDAEADPGKECRNHLHVNVAHAAAAGRIDFNRLHVPTAYVLVEHVLRFLFHDLEVTPKTPKWPEILRASETAFYERFTGKRYRHRS